MTHRKVTFFVENITFPVIKRQFTSTRKLAGVSGCWWPPTMWKIPSRCHFKSID